MDSTILLWFGGPSAHKLNREDAKRIESDTGRRVTDLSECELVDSLRRLSIRKPELTEDDIEALNAVEAEGL